MTRSLALYSFTLALALLAHAADARAQVAVLRIDPQAEPFAREVESALKGVGVVPDPGYLREARAQSIDPTSDAALEMITPLLQLKLAVVPLFADEGSVQLEYRDGATGRKLGEASVPRAGGELTPSGREQVRHEVVAHLAAVIEGTPPPDDEAPEDQAPAQGESEAPDPASSLSARIHAGLGLGTRDVEWRSDGETQRVELGGFPAFDLGLTIGMRLSESVAFVPSVQYQSSLAFVEVEEPRVGAPPDHVGVRSHRFAAAFGLSFALDGEGSAAITPALGFGVRNLRPEVHHLSTPAYSLAGPLLRIGLYLPLGPVALQLAPEAQFLLVGEGLRERAVDGSGFGLGGEASLAVDLGAVLALELAYRRTHALLTSSSAGAADVDQFMVLRAVGKL